MVRLAETILLSCTNTDTISEWTKTRFHMTHVTYEFHRVRPKWFLNLWYVRRKMCTYLASRLALSSNKPKRASTWASSPRSTIECVQTEFWAYGMFGANRTPILHRHLHYLKTDQNKIPHNPCHLGVPSGWSKMIFEPLVCSVQPVHLSCVKISTISKRIKTSFHMTHIT
jgi:hypothetical protein